MDWDLEREGDQTKTGGIPRSNRDKLAPICFLLGSLLFVVDGIGHCNEQLTWHSVCYTLGSFLFAVGSASMLVLM